MGHYLYTQRNQATRFELAKLIGPSFFLIGGNKDTCFEFWYQIYQSNTNTLKVYLNSPNQDKQLLWALDGEMNPDSFTWFQAKIPFAQTSQSNFVIEVNASPGTLMKFYDNII